jgi:phospholipid/cholesterol/gamma-HCH transport system substrate-binding protein
MRVPQRTRQPAVWIVILLLVAVSGCQWRGLNSLPLPGTAGRGPGAFEIQAQIPDVTNIQQNSRVRVGDVTVGNVTKIERQGWHALVTIRLDGSVELPENATAKVGQTSLLGSLHIELAPPTDAAPTGRLHTGSLIPLASSGQYPSTEQTLAAVSTLLNGGGIGQLQDIVEALTTAFADGRAGELRRLLEQLDVFVRWLNAQTGDIIAATDELNGLAGQFAANQPIIDEALKTLPDAVEALSDRRDKLVEVLRKVGKLSEVTADTVNRSKESLAGDLNDLVPVVKSLADSDKSLIRSLGYLLTFPFPKDTVLNWIRGDYGNLSAIVDLTLSRVDSQLFTGTRWEGNLTKLENQWGRTIGQLPSPYTVGNPLTLPYHWNQGS